MDEFTPEAPSDLRRPVVTVGSFDGVHLGHLAVLQKVRDVASEIEGTAVVVTFDPHPRQVIDPSSAPPILSTRAEKGARIERAGIDALVVLPFTDALRSLDAEAFVRMHLVERLGVHAVVLGYDHGFGRERSGDTKTMSNLGQALGFSVLSVPPTLVGGEPVSSTRIRPLVETGAMDAACELLGSGYTLIGTVVRGDARGRTLGFPTANLLLPDPCKLRPSGGVYAAWARRKGETHAHRAVVNVGTRPTVDGRHETIEAHLLDFSGDLYDRELELELVHHLRSEKRFASLDALKNQIAADIETARRQLSAPESPPVGR